MDGDLFFILGNFGNLYVFCIERGEKEETRGEDGARDIPTPSPSASPFSFSSFSSFSSSLSSSFSNSLDMNLSSFTSSVSSVFNNMYVPSKCYTKNFRMELLCKTSLHPLMGVSLAYNEKEVIIILFVYFILFYFILFYFIILYITYNMYVPSKCYTKNFRMELLCKTSLHPLMGVSLAYNEKEVIMILFVYFILFYYIIYYI